MMFTIYSGLVAYADKDKDESLKFNKMWTCMTGMAYCIYLAYIYIYIISSIFFDLFV